MVRLVDSLLQRPSYSYGDANSRGRRHEHHRHVRPTLVAQPLSQLAMPAKHESVHRHSRLAPPIDHVPPVPRLQSNTYNAIHPAPYNSPTLYTPFLPLAGPGNTLDHTYVGHYPPNHALVACPPTRSSQLPFAHGSFATNHTIPGSPPVQVDSRLFAPGDMTGQPFGLQLPGTHTATRTPSATRPVTPSAPGSLSSFPTASSRYWDGAGGIQSRPLSPAYGASGMYSRAPVARPQSEGPRPREQARCRLRNQSDGATSPPFHGVISEPGVRPPSFQQAANEVVGTWTGEEDTSLVPEDVPAPRMQARDPQPLESEPAFLSGSIQDDIEPRTLEHLLSTPSPSSDPSTEDTSASSTPTPSLDTRRRGREKYGTHHESVMAHTEPQAAPSRLSEHDTDSSHYSDGESGTEDDKRNNYVAQSPCALPLSLPTTPRGLTSKNPLEAIAGGPTQDSTDREHVSVSEPAAQAEIQASSSSQTPSNEGLKNARARDFDKTEATCWSFAGARPSTEYQALVRDQTDAGQSLDQLAEEEPILQRSGNAQITTRAFGPGSSLSVGKEANLPEASRPLTGNPLKDIQLEAVTMLSGAAPASNHGEDGAPESETPDLASATKAASVSGAASGDVIAFGESTYETSPTTPKRRFARGGPRLISVTHVEHAQHNAAALPAPLTTSGTILNRGRWYDVSQAATSEDAKEEKQTGLLEEAFSAWPTVGLAGTEHIPSSTSQERVGWETTGRQTPAPMALSPLASPDLQPRRLQAPSAADRYDANVGTPRTAGRKSKKSLFGLSTKTGRRIRDVSPPASRAMDVPVPQLPPVLSVEPLELKLPPLDELTNLGPSFPPSFALGPGFVHANMDYAPTEWVQEPMKSLASFPLQSGRPSQMSPQSQSQCQSESFSSAPQSLHSTILPSGMTRAHHAESFMDHPTAASVILKPMQVQVAVEAVAIDAVDRYMAKKYLGGRLSGRSFAGRATAVGPGVMDISVGDTVFGVKEPGAETDILSGEEVVIGRTWLAPASGSPLTLPSLACVGGAGTAAQEVVTQHCLPLERGARVLILSADEGVGLLTLQLCRLADAGLHLVAQVPAHRPDTSSGPWPGSETSGSGPVRTAQQAMELSKANGAHEVVVGDAEWALSSVLHAESVDLLVDACGTATSHASATSRVMAPGGTVVMYDPLGTGDPSHLKYTASSGWRLGRMLKSAQHRYPHTTESSRGPQWLTLGDVATLSPSKAQDALVSLAHAVADGSVKPNFSHVLPQAHLTDLTLQIQRPSPRSDTLETFVVTLSDRKY